jgi:membrane fusion protein, multidrug efflux system
MIALDVVPKLPRLRRHVGAALLVLAGLAGCDRAPPSAPPAGGMPPPAVGVITAQPGPVAMTSELPGRLEAWRTAQVRARVAAIVQKRLFVEGSQVKAGQVLFELDAAPFRAVLASAEAAAARAEATLAQANAQVERNRPLAEAKAISAQEWLVTQTTAQQARADLAAARAAQQTARINLDYATVTSPIAGRVGRALVTEGALVGQGEATPLALVQQIDPLYVNFSEPAAELLRLRRAVDSGRLDRAGATAAAQLRVVLEDGSVYPRMGRLLFADQTVDPGTGQVSLRAELPNPSGFLLPGMFVKVRLALAEAPKGVRVPQQAVTRSPTGDSVMVVGEGNKPAPRPVRIGAALDSDWIVLDGLNAGDRVIVDGFQKMRPGLAVDPVPWAPPAQGAASAPAAAAASAPAASSAAKR